MDDVTFCCTTYPDATQFLGKMRSHLEADEARYGLMLGLVERLVDEPHAFGDHDPYFATVAVGQAIGAGAIMTPPHGVILYVAPELIGAPDLGALLTPIAQDLHANGWPVPTVNGPVAASSSFAKLWSGLTGVNHEPAIATRIFSLREVIHPTYSTGALRPATQAELELGTAWYADFTREAEHNDEPDIARLRQTVQYKIDQQQLYFWIDGEPVSMAGLTRPTAHGIAIGPVYTPPQFRGHGYASSAVARLSQQVLDAGKEFCALFTDVANPTSNHIYQEIGYRAVEDFQTYRFQ